MIAVFTGFAFSSMLPIQTLGFGLAVAIFLDSTIVRMIIVPAAMKLLGHLNWWYPGNKSVVKIPGNDDQQIKGGIFK
jgi:RND superfamily putative drug exporter